MLSYRLLVIRIKGGVKEAASITREVEVFYEGAGLSSTVETVHASVFPFYGEWAFVASITESYDDFLKVDITTPNRAEVPETARVCKVSVTTKDTYGAVAMAPPCLLYTSPSPRDS